MSPARPRLAVLLAAALLALLPALASALPLENKWRLQFSGNAESAGEVVLAITPRGRDAIEVRIAIAEGTSENGVARAVRDGLRAAIGEDFKVETDDGEDVLVKRRLGRPRFNVTTVEITAGGVRLNLDQE